MTLKTAVIAAVLAALAAALVMADETSRPIIVTDIGRAMRPTSFYIKVFRWTPGPDGQLSIPAVSLTHQGPPASALTAAVDASVIYLGVDDIDATLASIKANGGKIIAPRRVAPGLMILALFADPGGNRMGLVEMKDGKPVTPPAR